MISVIVASATAGDCDPHHILAAAEGLLLATRDRDGQSMAGQAAINI